MAILIHQIAWHEKSEHVQKFKCPESQNSTLKGIIFVIVLMMKTSSLSIFMFFCQKEQLFKTENTAVLSFFDQPAIVVPLH